MLRQNEIETRMVDRLAWAVLEAFHKKGVLTWHMWPNPRPVEIATGPTTLTLSLDLKKPEHDLAKALKMGPIVKKYVAEVFALPETSYFDVHILDGVRYVLVTVPHPDPWYPEFSEVADLATDDLILGVDMFNRAVYHDLWQPLASAIISGQPGSGKTNTMRLLTAQAIKQGWKVYLVAAKGIVAGKGSSEWTDIAPFCEKVAISHKETGEILSQISKECKARAHGQKQIDDGILLIVDELLEMNSDHEKALGQLLRVRRTAGFRALLGCKVVGKEVAKDVRASVGYRIVHTCATSIESQTATGIPNLGAEKLRVGEAIMVDPASRVSRLVVAKADTEDVAHLLLSLPSANESAKSFKPKSKFDLILDRWKEEEEASTRGLQAPPRWILARALAYFHANGKPPSHRLMDAWHHKRQGETISQTRRKMVKEAIQELVKP